MKRLRNLPGFSLLTSFSLLAGVWLVAYLMMRWPIGDSMLRASYDWLHLTGSHRPDPQVVLIVMNEDTDRTLQRKQGEPFQRSDHARLLERLKDSGTERVCYDILFDLPASDPAVDERFAAAIRSHGRVILGGVEEAARRESGMSQQLAVAPTPVLRAAAEGWGLLNVSAKDADGVVRRFDMRPDLALPFALVAARAEKPEQEVSIPENAWLHYPTRPGEFTTFEFADCLDRSVVPDDALRGKTIFIGGQYATEPYGSRDLFATPYQRFGMPEIPGLAWHATVFLNARDQLWIQPAGHIRAVVWCLPFAMAACLLLTNIRAWLLGVVWGALAVLLMVAAVFLSWNDHILVNWLVPVGVQFPLCLFGLVLRRAALPRFRYLPPALRRELDSVEVFISFSSPDKARAESLKTLLDAHGHPAWLCVHNIVAGTPWSEAIAVALQQCRVVVFLRSQHSLASRYCRNELMVAAERGTPILPIRLDEAKTPIELKILLGTTQHVDARHKTDTELSSEVLAALDTMIRREESEISAS